MRDRLPLSKPTPYFTHHINLTFFCWRIRFLTFYHLKAQDDLLKSETTEFFLLFRYHCITLVLTFLKIGFPAVIESPFQPQVFWSKTDSWKYSLADIINVKYYCNVFQP